jgi:beta-glucosidase
MRVPSDMLSFTGHGGVRVVEPGTFDIMIGASSADIRLRGEVALVGNLTRIEGNWRMESRSTASPAAT